MVPQAPHDPKTDYRPMVPSRAQATLRPPSGTSTYIGSMLRKRKQSHRYVRNPVRWGRDKLNAFYWSKQREIMNTVIRHPRTSVRSAHDTGKSFIAGNLAAHWLDVHPVGSAFVVTTAPTAPQVEAILWREIGRCHTKGQLPGRITSGTIPKWKIPTSPYLGKASPDEIVAYGRKPADLKDEATASQAFQGIHARYLLVIMDEACGIPDWLWNAVETIATNRFARVLAIGNPDVPQTKFEETFAPASGWANIKISAFDTPAWTGETVPDGLLDDLVSPDWVTRREIDWGIASPLYQSKVLADFPEVTEETLIHPKYIRHAQLLDLTSESLSAPGRFGLDVARSIVGNETACYRNRAGHVRMQFAMHTNDTMRTVGRCTRVLNSTFGQAPMHVDTIGVGGGVHDRLKEQGFPTVAFVANEAPSTPTARRRFVNKRAEQYWNLRTMFERGQIDLAPQGEDDKLVAQLTSIKYFIRSDGRIIVESKEEMAERGLPSPDRADAFMMACAQPLPKAGDFWLPPLPAQTMSAVGQPSSVDLASITADLLERTW
jgi:hypothetical protein